MIGRNMKRIAATLVSATVLFALALSGSALAAGSSACQAYNPQLCSVSTTSTTSPSSSTLPFTGVDVALLVAGGIVLLGAGFVVRVASRRVSD
jgi:hypothetical protein